MSAARDAVDNEVKTKGEFWKIWLMEEPQHLSLHCKDMDLDQLVAQVAQQANILQSIEKLEKLIKAVAKGHKESQALSD